MGLRSFLLDPIQEDTCHRVREQGESRWDGAWRGGRYHVKGVVRRSSRGPSEEARKCSWRKSSAFNSNQAQNAQQGEATLTFHTEASCLLSASKGDLTLNPVQRFWNTHQTRHSNYQMESPRTFYYLGHNREATGPAIGWGKTRNTKINMHLEHIPGIVPV